MSSAFSTRLLSRDLPPTLWNPLDQNFCIFWKGVFCGKFSVTTHWLPHISMKFMNYQGLFFTSLTCSDFYMGFYFIIHTQKTQSNCLCPICASVHIHMRDQKFNDFQFFVIKTKKKKFCYCFMQKNYPAKFFSYLSKILLFNNGTLIFPKNVILIFICLEVINSHFCWSKSFINSNHLFLKTETHCPKIIDNKRGL